MCFFIPKVSLPVFTTPLELTVLNNGLFRCLPLQNLIAENLLQKENTNIFARCIRT